MHPWFKASPANLIAVSDVFCSMPIKQTNEQIQSTCFLGVWTPCPQGLPSRAGYQTGMIRFCSTVSGRISWPSETHSRSESAQSCCRIPRNVLANLLSRARGTINRSPDRIAHLSAPSERCGSDKLINLWCTWSKLGYVESLKRRKCPEGQACCRIYFRINISRLCVYQ